MNTIDHYLPLILVGIIAILLIKIAFLKLKIETLNDRILEMIETHKDDLFNKDMIICDLNDKIQALEMRHESIEIDIANNKIKFLEKKVIDQQNTLITYCKIIRSFFRIRIDSILKPLKPKR